MSIDYHDQIVIGSDNIQDFVLALQDIELILCMMQECDDREKRMLYLKEAIAKVREIGALCEDYDILFVEPTDIVKRACYVQKIMNIGQKDEGELC